MRNFTPVRCSRSEILSRRRLASPLARKRSRSITVVKSAGSNSGRLTPSGRAARVGDAKRKAVVGSSVAAKVDRK